MIILVGSSASGKTYIAQKLKSLGYKKFVTTTTRSPRVGEKDAVDYNFVSIEQFKKMKNNAEFIETVFYNGNYYGTEKKKIDLDTVLIVEPQGLEHFLNLHDPTIVSFYLNTPKEIRKERMIARGDDAKEIKKRLDNDDQIFSIVKKLNVDYFIDTEKLTADEIVHFIDKKYKERISQIKK